MGISSEICDSLFFRKNEQFSEEEKRFEELKFAVVERKVSCFQVKETDLKN